MKTNDTEIKALINLLDDPDEGVYQHIRSRLIELGNPVIPSLENVWEFNSLGALFQDRIEDIVHHIQFEDVKHQLTKWVQLPLPSLLDGLLIINQYQYPELDTQIIKDEIKRLSREIWIELNDELTALEKVRIFNQVIFQNHGYRGNKQNYHSPNNSYLSTIIETKKGNPILLSALYLLVAEELDEPIYGVNLPHHFITAYIDKHQLAKLLNENNSDVLFYINCFSQGSILHQKELLDFLEQLNIAPQAKFFEPCSNLAIVKRVLRNLKHSYQQAGLIEKVDEIDTLLILLSQANG